MFYRIKPYLFLFLTAITAYWQIALLNKTLKWDMIDCLLPWRYFMGECLQNKIFPLWNPYQNLGTPFYVDMQTSAWSPEAILTGLLTDHSIYPLQLLFVFYVFIAGAGMFRFTEYFVQNKYAALITATSYMLSGFFVSHVQHFHAVISAACIPWFLFFFIQMLNEPKRNHPLKCAFIFFYMVAAGYATFTIITGYLCFVLLLLHVVNYVRSKEFQKIKKMAYTLTVFAVVAVLLCSPVIVSIMQSRPYVDRYGEGITYVRAAVNPFSPQSLLSFIAPFSSVSDPNFFHTDMAMSNLYFGIIALIVLMASVGIKKTILQILLWSMAIIFLLLAMGDHLPLFRLSRSLPMLDLFRFPSYYGYFSILCFLWIAAFFFDKYFSDTEKYKNALCISSFMMLFLLFIVFIVSFFKTDIDALSYYKTFPSYGEWIVSGNVYESTLLYILLQLGVTGVFLFIVLKSQKPGIVVLFLVTAEMIVSVQGTIFKTAVSTYNIHEFAEKLKEYPKGFPVPDLSEKVKDAIDNDNKIYGFWRNTNIFKKKISADGFTSFHLTGFNNLEMKMPNLFKASINNPFIFLSDQIHSLNNFHDSLIVPDVNNRDIYLDENDLQIIKNTTLVLTKGDSIHIDSFEPYNITLTTQTKATTIITLLQSNYPGWEFYVDNTQVQKYIINTNFMGTLLPAGKHILRFVYKNNYILYAACVGYGTMLLLFGYFASSFVRKAFSRKHKI